MSADTIQKISLLLAGWLLGLFSKEIQEWLARWIRGPKIKLSFDSSEDCVTLTPESYQVQSTGSTVGSYAEQRVVFFARVRVTNTKARVARDCRAYLVNVEEVVDGAARATQFSDSIPLIWSYCAEAAAVDIPKGIKHYIDVVRIVSTAQEFEPQMRAHDGALLMPARYQPLFRRCGTLQFTVLVAAGELAPRSIKIIVRWDGNWPQLHRSMNGDNKMTNDIKTKQSFGTVKVDHFSPARKEGWPKAINVVLSFEEALKLHLGLGQALAKLNTYDLSTKRGRGSAVNLCVFTDVGSVAINEGQVRREVIERADRVVSGYSR